VADFFSKYQGEGIFGPKLGRVGTILEGKVPHGIFDRMEVDRDVGPIKHMAAKGTEAIHSRYIKGGTGYKGLSEFASKSHLKDYLSTASGKSRFGKGVALTGAGLLGAYSVGHELKKLIRNKN